MGLGQGKIDNIGQGEVEKKKVQTLSRTWTRKNRKEEKFPE